MYVSVYIYATCCCRDRHSDGRVSGSDSGCGLDVILASLPGSLADRVGLVAVVGVCVYTHILHTYALCIYLSL